MQIARDKVVYFHYTLSEVGGAELEASDRAEPMAYLHGHDNLLPALEAQMAGREKGETFTATLAPEHAYGLRREGAAQRIPIKHLAYEGKLRPGMSVRVNTGEGPREVRVLKVGRFNVDVDTNHPLAGMSLTFSIEIVDVREATAEELRHRHVHGAGGHDH